MYLGPHHFQAQARYFEDSIHFAASSLWFAGYGLAACELDAEAMNNGTLSLIRARGILPDGLAFEMPDCDPLPAARNITESFPPLADRLTIYLGVPAYRPNAVNCTPPEGHDDVRARYSSDRQVVPDENTGRDEKPVHFGRKNIAFYLENEVSEDLITLPLARVKRSGAGHFIYDPDFIPPCLLLTASERLMGMLRRLVDILGEKSEAFQRAPARGGDMSASFSQQEVASFWFLHCVNSSLVRLRNICFSKRGHPEEAFVGALPPGRSALHVRIGLAPGQPPVIRPPPSGGVLRRSGPSHPVPSRDDPPDQLRHDSPEAGGRLLLRRRGHRPKVPRPRALDLLDSISHGRGGPDSDHPAACEGLLEGVRLQAGAAGPSGNDDDAPAGAALGGGSEGGMPVLRPDQSRTAVGSTS